MAMLFSSARTLAQWHMQRQPCATVRIAPILASVVLVLGLTMPVQAFAETLEQRVARLAPHFTVRRPEQATAPTPVVIMLHGCGGPRPFIAEMADAAARAGATAVVVDSFAPRRISRIAAFATVCTGARLQGRERAGDLYAAMTWARAQPWADPNRIGVIGWSHGGWTIMDALALRSGEEMRRATGLDDLEGEPLTGLTATMIVYPYAGVGTYAGRRDWRLAPRSTAIIAERDYIVGSSRAALERQRARGTPMEILLFENATHAFEDQHAEDPRVRYSAASTAREHALLQEMIEAL
ncbi:MAG: dienelactone hydrolase family protein [Caulobacteraceae bacterium]